MQALLELGAKLSPLAKLSESLNVISANSVSELHRVYKPVREAIDAAIRAEIEAFSRKPAAGDAFAYVLFYQGTATLIGDPIALGKAIAVAFPDTGAVDLVGKWLLTAKLGDIGSFLLSEGRTGGFNVMVVSESWVSHL